MTLTLTVYGIAAPKGSPNRWRVQRSDGREVTVLSEPKGTKEWQRMVSAAAQTVAAERTMRGPVEVSLRFYLPRPKSAPKRRRTWPIGRTKDIDKLIRAVLDGLTGPVLLDDGDVVSLTATKDYGDPPRVEVEIAEIEEVPA